MAEDERVEHNKESNFLSICEKYVKMKIDE